LRIDAKEAKSRWCTSIFLFSVLLIISSANEQEPSTHEKHSLYWSSHRGDYGGYYFLGCDGVYYNDFQINNFAIMSVARLHNGFLWASWVQLRSYLEEKVVAAV
jgi:hypothetical protein